LIERLGRRTEAVADITSSWGREQNVIGPMLGIPYQYKFKPSKRFQHRMAKSSDARWKRLLLRTLIFAQTLNVSGKGIRPPVAGFERSFFRRRPAAKTLAKEQTVASSAEESALGKNQVATGSFSRQMMRIRSGFDPDVVALRRV
jgi:hypothetical protein